MLNETPDFSIFTAPEIADAVFALPVEKFLELNYLITTRVQAANLTAEQALFEHKQKRGRDEIRKRLDKIFKEETNGENAD